MANFPLKIFTQVHLEHLPILIVEGNFSTPYTSNNPVAFDTVIVDNYSAYSTLTGQYTVPVKGVYRISGSAGGNFPNGSAVYTSKNNDTSNYPGVNVANGGGVAVVSTRLVSCDVGDTLDFRCAGSSSASTASYNNLSIELVSRLE